MIDLFCHILITNMSWRRTQLTSVYFLITILTISFAFFVFRIIFTFTFKILFLKFRYLFCESVQLILSK